MVNINLYTFFRTMFLINRYVIPFVLYLEIHAIYYGTQTVTTSNSPTLLDLSSVPKGYEGNTSLTLVHSSHDSPTVLYEVSNNDSHVYIIPHNGWADTTVKWLQVSLVYHLADIRQGQVEIRYSTKTMCKFIFFSRVSNTIIIFNLKSFHHTMR